MPLRMEEKRDLRSKGNEGWSMFYHQGIRDKIPLVKSKALKPADWCTWAALLSELDWKSGHVRISPTMLADLLGWSLANTNNSLKRLRLCGVVAKGRRRDGGIYWMVNPEMLVSGGWKTRDRRFAQWNEMRVKEGYELDQKVLAEVAA